MSLQAYNSFVRMKRRPNATNTEIKDAQKYFEKLDKKMEND